MLSAYFLRKIHSIMTLHQDFFANQFCSTIKGVRSQYYCPLTPAEGITPSNFFYLLAFCGYSF